MGEGHNLGKANTFMAQHLLVPKTGSCCAYQCIQFSCVGLKSCREYARRCSSSCKPATVTSYLTEAVVKKLLHQAFFPKAHCNWSAAVQDMLDYVQSRDVVTFYRFCFHRIIIKTNKSILENNALQYGSRQFELHHTWWRCKAPSMPEWDGFYKRNKKGWQWRAGQKCTAIRRIFVPA